MVTPLDHPGMVKIALSQAASEALAAVGKYHLVMAAPTDCTAPESLRGRMVLHCLPLDKETADAAARVARGAHRATKIRTNASDTDARPGPVTLVPLTAPSEGGAITVAAPPPPAR